MASSSVLVPVERIQHLVLLIRGQRVIIDADLAALYDIPTKALNQAVKRNAERFPADFMFSLSPEEKSQLVTRCDRFATLKHSSTLPYAFTEHGAIMAASVLNSPRAVEVSVYVVRAFVRLRELLSTQKRLGEKFKELESKLETHDRQITVIIEAIKELMHEPEKPKRRIGFGSGDAK